MIAGLLAIAPLALVVALAAVPLITLVIVGLGNPGDALAILTAGSTWRVLGYTITQALLSTVASIVLALPAAYALHRLQIPGRRVMLAVLTIPFVLPTVVVGLAFRELLPFAGTTAAIIVAHVFFNIGLATRIIGAVWAGLDPRFSDVGASLGLSEWRVLTRVTWPQLRPAILAAASLVLLFTFTSFGVVLIVGDPAWPTIEVDIYRRAVQQLDLDAAATLAIVQLLVVIAALAWSARLQQRMSVARSHADLGQRVHPRSAVDRISVIISVILTVAVLVPILRLVVGSLRVGDRWGTDFYREVFSPTDATTRSTPAWESIVTSGRYALIATVIAVILGVAGAIAISLLRRGSTGLDTSLTVPLGVSAVSIGLGLLLFSLRGPIDMRGWSLLVPLGQALVAMPIVIRVVLPVLRSIDPRLREVAATLGAAPVRAWWEVNGRLALRATAVAAAFAAAVSLGEFGATAFLVRADTPTIPVQIVRLLGRPGEANLGQALALSVILIIVTATVIAVAERARPARGVPW